jgi:hypothetical protein
MQKRQLHPSEYRIGLERKDKSSGATTFIILLVVCICIIISVAIITKNRLKKKSPAQILMQD